MKERISKDISAINKAIGWERYLDESKREAWHSTLINVQRDLEDIGFANEERPSVAAYGESQMGKSYLVSAMLSDPDIPFCISDGTRTYDFIKEINPSEDNASIEATGLVTRFHLPKAGATALSKDWVQVRMLTVADLVLLLVEAWCNEVIRHSSPDVRLWLEKIDERKNNCPRRECSNPLLSEVELAYMDKYLREADSGSNFGNINSSKLINFLRQNVGRISNEDTIALLRLLWDENKDFNRLFDDLLRYYRELDFQQTAYVEFKALLKEHGTLLDVERLNEMYGEPSTRVDRARYIPEATIRFTEHGAMKRISKPFLSALVAEIGIMVDDSFATKRPFLEHFDILDFPGLRPKDEREEELLDTADNLATVFRRGKVTYLFKKYSRSKRISSLLFCHNHNQSNACKLGSVLTGWVETNVGATPEARRQSSQDLGGSPLMLVSTWFNKNLEYSDERLGDNLNSRWETRFVTVLTGQVLKAKDLPSHWFNSWGASGEPFRSLFLLRSFKFSKTTFSGWDPNAHTQESAEKPVPQFPDFLSQLKESFVTNSFVHERFADATGHWDACATPGNDGTKPIITRLNELAPKAEEARRRKFERDLYGMEKTLTDLLKKEYHDDDPTEQTKKAAKEVVKLILSIEAHCGNDSYFWSRMMSEMMIPERMVRASVFASINGYQAAKPLSAPEAEIFMNAGLSTEVTPEENLRRLMEYLFVDSREECEEILRDTDPEIDIDNLLNRQTMVASISEQVVETIEQLWMNDFLTKWVASGNAFPNMAAITGKMVELYKMLEVRKKLVKEVRHLMDTLVANKQVGIVASWLTMSLNKFVGEFGYSYMSDETRRNVMKKSQDFRLAIDATLLEDTPPTDGIQLLEQIDVVKRALEERGFNDNLREQQKLLPQYRSRWQWENRMRAAFAATSGFQKFNVAANKEIKSIIDSLAMNPSNS